MGAACCAEDRNDGKYNKQRQRNSKEYVTPGSPDSPQVLKSQENLPKGFLETKESQITEKARKSKSPIFSPDGAAQDDEIIVDFYWCSAEGFPIYWEKEILKSQQFVTPVDGKEDSAKPLPFLITLFSDQGQHAMICSKPYPRLYRSVLRDFSTKQIIEKIVRRKFISRAMNETVFRDEISIFLKYFY